MCLGEVPRHALRLDPLLARERDAGDSRTSRRDAYGSLVLPEAAGEELLARDVDHRAAHGGWSGSAWSDTKTIPPSWTFLAAFRYTAFARYHRKC
jgi:hypothetical protein